MLSLSLALFSPSLFLYPSSLLALSPSPNIYTHLSISLSPLLISLITVLRPACSHIYSVATLPISLLYLSLPTSLSISLSLPLSPYTVISLQTT